MITFDELNAIYPVRSLLEDLGIDKIEENTQRYKFSSPFREDKNPSSVLYKNNLYCVDFSSGFEGSIFKLVREITGQNLYTYCGIDTNSLSDSVFSSSLKGRKPKRTFEDISQEKKAVRTRGKINRNKYARPDVRDYCQERFLFDDFWEHFNLSWTEFSIFNGFEDVPFRNRVLIPITEGGKTLSVEGRDFTGRQSKKALYPRGGTVSTLFNLDDLDRTEPLVIVEGILDIPKIWKFFTKNITTTFGIHLTRRQKQLLGDFSNIILFPDDDEAGKRMIYNFDEFLEVDFRVATVSGKDPGDAKIREIGKALDSAKSFIDFQLEDSGLFEKENPNLEFFEVT